MARNIIEEVLKVTVKDRELQRHRKYLSASLRSIDRQVKKGNLTTHQAINLRRRLVAEEKRLARAVQRTARRQAAWNKAMERVKRVAQSAARWIRRGLLLVLIGLTVVFGKAVVEAAKFSARMQDVANLMNATASQVTLFRESVLQMYQTIAAGNLREFASALYNINSAGFRAAKGLMVLAASSKLAIAAATSVDVSTRVLTKVLNIYRKEAELAADVTDMLVATVAQAESSLEGMAAAIPTVLPQARAAQISLEETLGVFAVLTKTANSPETAAVQFDRLINSLGESVDRLRELGLEVNDFGLTSAGLVDTIFQLVDKLGHGNVAGLREIFKEIRGFRAVLGLLVQGQENVVASVEEVGNSAGEAARDFGKMKQEATLTAKSIKNELHAALVNLGLKALPTAVKWMEKLRTVIRSVLGTLKEGSAIDRASFLEQFNLSPEEIRGSLDALRNTRNELRISLLEFQEPFRHWPYKAQSTDEREEEGRQKVVLAKLDIEIDAREKLLKQAESLASARERDTAAMEEERRVAEGVQKALLDAQRAEQAYEAGLPGTIREAQREYKKYVELAEKAVDTLQKQKYYLEAINWQHKLLKREAGSAIQRVVNVEKVSTLAPGIPLDLSVLEPVPDRTLTSLDEYDRQIGELEEALGKATIGSNKFLDITSRLKELSETRAELARTTETARDLYGSFVDLGHAFARFFDTAEAGSPLFRDLLYGATQFADTIGQVKDMGGMSSFSGKGGLQNAIGVLGPLLGTFGTILSSFKERSLRDEERARKEHETRLRLLEAIEKTVQRVSKVIRDLRDIDVYGDSLSAADAERAAFHAQGIRSNIEKASRDPSSASGYAYDFRTHLQRLADIGVKGAQDFLDLYAQELARTNSRAEAMQAVLNAGLQGWLTQLENFGDFAPTVAGATRELEIFMQFLGGTAAEGLKRFVDALLKVEGLSPALRELLTEIGALDPNAPVDKARLDEIIAYIISTPGIWGSLRGGDVSDLLSTIQGLGDGTYTGGRETRDVRSARQITEITGSELVAIAREQLASLRDILAALLSGTRSSLPVATGYGRPPHITPPPQIPIPHPRPPSLPQIPIPPPLAPITPPPETPIPPPRPPRPSDRPPPEKKIYVTIGDISVDGPGDDSAEELARRVGRATEDQVRRRLGARRNL